jgi:chromosome segregation ATPase
MATVITEGEQVAGELTEPIVDLAKDAGKAEATLEHHAEHLAAHDTKLAEHEAVWEIAKSRLDSLESRAASLPEEILSSVNSQVSEVRGDLEELRNSVNEKIGTNENSEHETEPPEKKENRAEKPSLLGHVRSALHRLL